MIYIIETQKCFTHHNVDIFNENIEISSLMDEHFGKMPIFRSEGKALSIMM